MIGILVLLAVTALLFVFKEDDRFQTVYNGSESDLGEANEYYWLLKNHNIPFKYQIPYNWRNFYEFGYKESSVYIKVSEKDVERARKVMMYHRAEKWKMERNIEAAKKHH